MALLSASTEEGLTIRCWKLRPRAFPLLSARPVHQVLDSPFFPVDDDGRALAQHLIDLCQDQVLWGDLSQRGLALARSLSVERQVEAISSQIKALAFLR